MQYTAAEKLNEGNDASKTFIETDDAPIRNGSLLHGAASYCTGRSPDLCAFHRRTRRRTLAVALALAVPALTARWINHFWPDLVHPSVFLICALLLLAFVIAHLLHFILQAPVVTVEVLCASVSVYLMLGLMWTVAYWLVDQLTPGGAFSFNTSRGAQSMNGFTGFYFSFITLSTVGYGDITPVSRAARWLAAMEAMTGLLYVAVLIARLVSLYSSTKQDNS